MRTVLPLFAAFLALASTARAASVQLKTDDQKSLYALGVLLSRNLTDLNLTSDELDLLKAGLTDAALQHKLEVDPSSWPQVQHFVQARMAAAASNEKKKSEAFLAKAGAEKGAIKTASGLVYKEVKPGTGAQPKPTDTVKVHYTGTLTDGTVFDSSVQRGQPATFPLNGVIKCWTEGLQRMKVGGESRLVCPSDLAYGDRGAPPRIKPGATLVFDVQLLDIVK